jgi:hypothetical protein
MAEPWRLENALSEIFRLSMFEMYILNDEISLRLCINILNI